MELQLVEKDGKTLLNTDLLEKAIKEGMLGVVKAAIQDELKVEKLKIFTGGDKDLLDREGKTVVDTSFFTKKYGANRTGDPIVDGSELGKRLAASGGPFLRLSPAMLEFAECCRVGFDPSKLMGRNINLSDYNKRTADWNKKDTMSSGLSSTDAGALVPIEFLATVIEFAIGQSQILPRLWRIPMGGQTIRIPQLTQASGSYFGGILLYHPDELESKTPTKPTFSYKEFIAKKLIGLCPLSDELIMDTPINIINYITGVFVRAFQYIQEGEVIAGTGLLNQMLGILNDPGIVVVGRTTANTVKYEDMINLESGLDENFQNLTYITRRATFNAVRLQKSTTGQPVWQLFYPLPGQGAQFNEYPVIKTRNVPALGSKGDVILGDLSFYIWAVRQDMTIDLSKDRYFEYDVTALRFVMRMDGKPAVPIAFAVLDSHPES